MGDRRQAVAVADGQCVQKGLPTVDSSSRVGPVLSPLDRCEVEHLERGLLGREMAAANGDFAEPGVERLDSVRGVDDFAELGGELEKRDDVFSCISPRFDHRRIDGLPVLSERHCCVDGSARCSARVSECVKTRISHHRWIGQRSLATGFRRK